MSRDWSEVGKSVKNDDLWFSQGRSDVRETLSEAIAEIEQLRQEKADLIEMGVRILSDLEVMMRYCPERDKYHIQQDRNMKFVKALAKLEGGEPNAKP